MVNGVQPESGVTLTPVSIPQPGTDTVEPEENQTPSAVEVRTDPAEPVVAEPVEEAPPTESQETSPPPSSVGPRGQVVDLLA